MRALLRLIVPLVGLLTLSMMVFILIGRTRQPPELVRQLHLTDCTMPCWIGITPGATQADVVNRYVMDTFNSTNSQLSSSVPSYEWFTIVSLKHPARRGEGMPIQFGVNRGIVGEILIPAFFGSSTPDVTMPALGDMVNLLGEPDCVGSNSLPTSGNLSLFYTFDSALVEIGLVTADHPRWSDRIYFLSIRRNDLSNRVNDCTWAGIALPAWAGLMDGDHYLKRFT